MIHVKVSFLHCSGDFDANMDKHQPAGDFNGAGRDIEIITRPPPTTPPSTAGGEKVVLPYRSRDIEVFTLPSAIKPSTDFLLERTEEVDAGGGRKVLPPATVTRTPMENLAQARAKLKDLEVYRRPEINSKIREINTFFVGTKDLRYSDTTDKPYVSLLGMTRHYSLQAPHIAL
jgi:hypothetical protein